MKKVITFVVILCVLLFAFSVCTYAQEANIEAGITMSTVYDRAIEWWKENEDEISTVVSFVATALFAMFIKKIKAGILDLTVKIKSLISTSTNSTNKQDELILGFNGQIDVIEKLVSENSALKAINEQNAKEIVATKQEIAHIAHILTTVYTNSKALPQGVRDMINIECAQCMRIAAGEPENDEVHQDEAKEEDKE